MTLNWKTWLVGARGRVVGKEGRGFVGRGEGASWEAAEMKRQNVHCREATMV